ncbi:hypothetical protein KQX54_014618 [Cotesia glomerata]|uniref:phospholipase A1 n=1 Tax=Cotesia glomerata TaxID=32391 RepID=A0AAV7I5Z9_COTGL|nr:hypothetical protein KQX54_014618 [Cotesia glomerata]
MSSKTITCYFLILVIVVICDANYEDNIYFKLFTRKQQSDSKTIVISKEYNNILQIGFDVTKSTKVIVHGFKSSSNFLALVRIKNNYLSKYDCNVIMVDWSHYAEGEYVSTIGRSRIVAFYVARLFPVLMKHGVQDIHAIGFSLGAHIPAVATNYLGNNELKHITGLDPAKPFLMNVGLDAKLDSSDAEFVDVYHTESFIQGKAEACGHVDFKMNWGEIQPGCGDFNIGCAHERAPIIGEEVSRESVLKLAGEYVDRNVRGWYEVPTNTNSPFAKGLTNLLEKMEGRLAGLESMKQSLESMTETVATLVNDNKKILEDLKECQNKIGSIRNDVKEATSKIENVSRKVKDHNTRLAAVESKITGAAGANAVLADCDTSLRVACLSLANQIVVTGVPKTDDTTDPNKLAKDFVPALTNCLDVALSDFEIIRAQRMGRKKINV